MSAAPTQPAALGRDHESDLRSLLRLALPIMGMTVTRMLMGFVDVFMVSRLGTDALAAISPASIFVFALACLGMGAATSVQTFVSQADGRGEPREAGGYIWQVFYITLGFVALAPPIAVSTPDWFGWIASFSHTSPSVAKMEIDYIAIALWSVPATVLCAGLQGFFNGIQRPMVPLVAALISLAFNVGGNWLLIYGNLGCPRMGIAGAAVATTASWIVRALIMAAWLLTPKIDEAFNTRHSMAFCWKKFAGIWRIGGPTAVQWLVDIGAWVVFLSIIIPPYGEVAMAASNVTLQYMHLSFMPAIGIGMALCSQVGFAIGEERPERAYRKARVAFRVAGAYMGAVGLLFLLGGAWIMRLFTDDVEVIRVGRVVLIWAAIFQVFDAMCITYMNALRGAGDTKWPAAMVAFMCWVVFIGGGVACAKLFPDLGLSAPWMFCTLYVSILGVALWWRWEAGAWREIELFAKRPPSEPRDEASWVQPLDELECGVPDPATGAIEPAGSLRSPE